MKLQKFTACYACKGSPRRLLSKFLALPIVANRNTGNHITYIPQSSTCRSNSVRMYCKFPKIYKCPLSLFSPKFLHRYFCQVWMPCIELLLGMLSVCSWLSFVIKGVVHMYAQNYYRLIHWLLTRLLPLGLRTWAYEMPHVVHAQRSCCFFAKP